MTPKKPEPGGSASESADFAAFCALLGPINLGERAFPIDMHALEQWVAAREWPAETADRLSKVRARAVAAYLAHDMGELRDRVEELHLLIDSLRAKEYAHRTSTAQSKRAPFEND